MKTPQPARPTSNLNRKRKEGKSEKKMEDDKRVKKGKNVDVPKSRSMLKDDHDVEGFDNGSARSKVVESMGQDPDDNDTGLTEGSETEGDVEFSRSDEEDIGINDQPTSEDSVHLSSFNLHLEHNLSQEEISDQRNRKFIWEIPAIGISNCKWTGTGENILEDLHINSCDSLKEKLYKHWMDVYKTSGGKDMYSPKQKIFVSLCSSYRDILYCNKRPFYLKGLEDISIMDAYIMHSLNHIFRTRDCVKKNDAKLTRLGESADIDRFRDQGFTRPKSSKRME
ncbi:protein NUCLEOLAR FACTOR 1-like [Gastrolobium bilobum]|uniref:protein NUCLEOLAR FACTOR 1-like n=1 Tax=Gastrolobium bilobum TaxID=150636 RepID=UPI002AB1216E|nr:protein NUCLEOLAR FACTOR 1-like [Gastrolobium bilobum]